MSKQEITAIAEGYNGKRSNLLLYKPIHAYIPVNAGVLRIGYDRFVLHEKVRCNIRQPMTGHDNNKSIKGYEIFNYDSEMDVLFENTRSIFTKKGFLYVNSRYFSSRSRRYWKAIEDVVVSSVFALAGIETTEELNKLRQKIPN